MFETQGGAPPTSKAEDQEFQEAIGRLALLVEAFDAMEQGRLGVARYRFEQVIRGRTATPRLEVGHAWRGMAEHAIFGGDVVQAEALLRRAVSAYQDVARTDPASRVRAREAEGAALLARAELLLRRGLDDASVELFERAGATYDALGDARSAEAWASIGRLARHRGELALARTALARAQASYDRARNFGGQAEALLELALVRRHEDGASTLRMLDLAATMARDAGRAEVLARVQIGRGSILRDDMRAQEAFFDAHRHARIAHARALTGLALVGLGSRGWEGGARPLLAGAQVLLEATHYPGLGLALVRLAEHGLNAGDGEVAAAAAEGAWRVHRSVSSRRGVAHVLGVVTRTFALQRQAWPTLLAAHARAATDVSPSAHRVRDHYYSLAPVAWTERLRGIGPETARSQVRGHLQGQIIPALRRLGLLPSSFATAQGALDVVGMLLGVSPRGAARQLAPVLSDERPTEMPEPRIPELDELHLAKRTTVRLSVTPGREVQREVPRARVYDPGGRMADMVFGSLNFVRDLAPTADAERAFGAFPEDQHAAFLSAEADEAPPAAPPTSSQLRGDGWTQLERDGFGTDGPPPLEDDNTEEAEIPPVRSSLPKLDP